MSIPHLVDVVNIQKVNRTSPIIHCILISLPSNLLPQSIDMRTSIINPQLDFFVIIILILIHILKRHVLQIEFILRRSILSQTNLTLGTTPQWHYPILDIKSIRKNWNSFLWPKFSCFHNTILISLERHNQYVRICRTNYSIFIADVFKEW